MGREIRRAFQNYKYDFHSTSVAAEWCDSGVHSTLLRVSLTAVCETIDAYFSVYFWSAI
jgi:hypothetical protein